MAKKTPLVNLNEIGSDRKHKLGICHMSPNGAMFRYAKIDFGSLGKTTDGKTLRLIQYRWLPWNRISALPFVHLTIEQ